MKKVLCLICGLGVLFFSCREDEADAVPGTDKAGRIYLRAMVENTIPTSRAPFTLAAPTESNPLKVAVWASDMPYQFKNLDKNGSDATSNYQVALHTKAIFSNGKEQLLNDAVYPNPSASGGAKPVYFVGLHPETATGTRWTTDAEGKKAIMTFNGSEDVMFAPQLSGSYAENVTADNWPTFYFKHLLTWLRVKVKSDSEAVSEAWGKIKSLKVRCGAGNTVEIDLGKAYNPVYNPADAANNSVTFSPEGATLDFYKTGTNEVYVNEADPDTWQSIPYNNAVEAAYVLCAPVVATERDIDSALTNEYTLLVKTERREVEVPVDLKQNALTGFTGSTMNYQFVLNLNFKMGDNIMLTASVTDWVMGGISNGVLMP